MKTASRLLKLKATVLRVFSMAELAGLVTRTVNMVMHQSQIVIFNACMMIKEEIVVVTGGTRCLT